MPGFTPHIRIRSILALGVALPATIAAFAGLTANAQNVLPQGGFVVGGTVTGSQTATALTINQSSARAIINWNSFSVGATNSVTFVQPNSSAAILNRVTGATQSNIAGQINANGQVFLVNPNGIAIGPTGTVNVGGGFVASTLGISNADFMNGNLQFFGNGSSARVSNQGTINVTGNNGFVALLGGSVINTGMISVPLGKVGFGAGEQITLDVNGDGFMQVALPSNATTSSGEPLISVAGSVNAAGGRIEISAATAAKAVRDLVNVSGNLSATSLAGRDGAIVLGGGPGADVNVTGTLDVSGTDNVGSIVATGAGVTLTGAMLNAQNQSGRGGTIIVTANDTVSLIGATLNASGVGGGGAIRIGGDFNGTGTIATAASTLVDAASLLKSDAFVSGNGGTVVVWSGNLTSFAGDISAKGGPLGGNGGMVEVSSKGVLGYRGLTNLSAVKGSFGTLLLDPYDIYIQDAPTSGGVPPGTSFVANAPSSVLNVNTLTDALALSDVAVRTGGVGSPGILESGSIFVNAPISWMTSTTLTLSAATNIVVNAPITAPAGTLTAIVGASVLNPDSLINVLYYIQPPPCPNCGGESTTTSAGAVVGADILGPLGGGVIMGGLGGSGGSSGGASGGSNTGAGTSTTTISYNTTPSTITNYNSGDSKQSSGSSGNSGSCSGQAISQNLNKTGSSVIFGSQSSSCN